MLDTLAIVLILLGKALEYPTTYNYYCSLIQKVSGGGCDDTAGTVITVLSVMCIMALVIFAYKAVSRENM